MVQFFQSNAILMLMVVIAIGYLLGNIRLFGIKLGVAAILFVGLGVGALDSNLATPQIITLLGLSMFVYTIGLSSGPGFFNAFNKKGIATIFFLLTMLLVLAGCMFLIHHWLDLDAATAASMFAGSTTNTPALAAILDIINQGSTTNPESVAKQAVIGYSLTYPMGVIGVMIAILICKKLLKIHFRTEEESLEDQYHLKQDLINVTIQVTNPEAANHTIRDLVQAHDWKVLFGRLEHRGEVTLSNWDTHLQKGDLVLAVGSSTAIQPVVAYLGEKTNRTVLSDNSYMIKRIFVSNPEATGQKIASLNLQEKYSAGIYRIRRGDMDLLATGDTVLELGDRIRFVARREDVPALQNFFGDSYDKLSQINLFSYGLGLSLGLLLGMIEFVLPGGLSFRLGYAGGPLLVGLLLGSIRRTGNIVWALPYSANLTLRQIGLIFLLASIGINSGHEFVDTLLSPEGLAIFGSGATAVILVTITTILLGYKWLKIPFSILIGMLANQPAILDFAQEQTDNRLPSIGFTFALPVLLVGKIIIAQILYLLFI